MVKRKIKPAVWILVGVATAVIFVDVLIYLAPPRKDTISEVILEIAYRHPLLPFLCGVLCGHWFWPNVRAGSLRE